MNLKSAMEYARHANDDKESIVCLTKWQNQYCAFALTYREDDDDGEIEKYYCIEYLGSKFNDFNSCEGDSYLGANLQELESEIVELISPEMLNFQVYESQVDMCSAIPFIYNELLPDLIPDYENVSDINLYQYQVDRTLNLINKR
tara:strand:- start:201 stop:635 length:435 start_codon:yes stop_codon:yes gene_type:complete